MAMASVMIRGGAAALGPGGHRVAAQRVPSVPTGDGSTGVGRPFSFVTLEIPSQALAAGFPTRETIPAMDETARLRAENERLRALLVRLYPYVPLSAGDADLQEELERALMGDDYRERQARAALAW